MKVNGGIKRRGGKLAVRLPNDEHQLQLKVAIGKHEGQHLIHLVLCQLSCGVREFQIGALAAPEYYGGLASYWKNKR